MDTRSTSSRKVLDSVVIIRVSRADSNAGTLLTEFNLLIPQVTRTPENAQYRPFVTIVLPRKMGPVAGGNSNPAESTHRSDSRVRLSGIGINAGGLQAIVKGTGITIPAS